MKFQSANTSFGRKSKLIPDGCLRMSKVSSIHTLYLPMVASIVCSCLANCSAEFSLRRCSAPCPLCRKSQEEILLTVYHDHESLAYSVLGRYVEMIVVSI